MILLQKRAPGGLLSITFRVIAYWFECKLCGHRGDMKAYESEMTRIAVIVTREALEFFGLFLEKENRSQKLSRPQLLAGASVHNTQAEDLGFDSVCDQDSDECINRQRPERRRDVAK